MQQEKMPGYLMLEELRLEFEREMDRKKTLEGKATSIITIAGIIVTLLFGFTTFSSTYLHNIIQSLSIPLYFIIIGVIGCICSIGISLWSIKPSHYAIVSNLEHFFDKEGKLNEEEIAKYMIAEDSQIIDDIISNYLNTNNIISKANSKKAGKVKLAHWVLFGSIVAIAIAIIPGILIILGILQFF